MPQVHSLKVLFMIFVILSGPNACDDESMALHFRPEASAESGGRLGTTDSTDSSAFSQALLGLDDQNQLHFLVGRALFRDVWVSAPSSTETRDGLGPIFNAKSCDVCHTNDGRGRPPNNPETPAFSLLLSLRNPNSTSGGDPIYGNQLQTQAVNGVPAEATLFVEQKNELLSEPVYILENLGYGQVHGATILSPRAAPALHGSGLLESIPKEQIINWEDPNDLDGDGISGRASRVASPYSGDQSIGRFGWQANTVDVMHQVAAAFRNDIGMTNSLFLKESCTPQQTECLSAQSGGEPELIDIFLERITQYTRMLAVPARRDVQSLEVRRGEAVFYDIGCESCHRQHFTTAEDAVPQSLAKQDIQPFTDLLLHDMGDRLADRNGAGENVSTEWRTPPLWGIGLFKTVNDHTRLLHDGRARDFNEAILWHGGEAEYSRFDYQALNQNDRRALLIFLDSI